MADQYPVTATMFGPAGREVPLYDPLTLHNQCIEQNISLEPWYRNANSLMNPLGVGPAKGMVLMTRRDLDAISKEEFHSWTLKTGTVQFACHKLRMLTAKAVDPSQQDNPNTCYYAEIVDQRHNFNRKAANARYNIVATSGSGYLTDTVNGDDPWTWQEILEDLWNKSVGSVSAVPTLSPVPHGTPENFDFQESYALDALCTLLDRLGWALRWVPWEETTPYDIVRIGAELAAADDLESGTVESTFIWDDYPLKSTKTSVPAKVNVLFRAYPLDCNQERFCTVTVPRQPGSYNNEQRETDTVFIIHDDLVARRRTGSGSQLQMCGSTSESGCSGISGCCDYTNATQMYERACERALDYYRMLTRAAEPWQRVYSGAKRLCPQTRYKAVHFQEWGLSIKTTVFRGFDILSPFGLWESWFKEFGFPCGGGGGGGGDSTSIGAFGICTYPEFMQLRSGPTCCNATTGFFTSVWIDAYAQDGSCAHEVFAYPDELAEAIDWHANLHYGNGTIQPGQECPTEEE